MSSESPTKTAVIVNPYSANGKTRKKWPVLRERIQEVIGDFTTYITERPGHASDLTRQALREGHDRIVSVGGDGTHHEVVNGFFDGYLPINPAATLAIFPHGTGSDLVRTVGVTSTTEALEALKGGHTQNIDLGRSTFTLESGEPKARYFINVADFGAGGAVVERVNGAKKRLGPMLTFFVALLRTVFTFKAPEVKLQLNGEIIERYPDARPYPSCLVLGWLALGDPLHVVCSRGDVEPALRIVTLYEPEDALWESDYRTRKVRR